MVDEFEKYFNSSLRYLSFRPRSKKELKDNLIKKKVPQEIISQIIERLKEHKFLDDKEFAKWWIEQRTKYKPRSDRLIIIELKQKGISEELVKEILSQHSEEAIPEVERAKKLIERKVQRLKGLSKFELTQKLGPMLLRRGFNYDVIKQAIDGVIDEGV